MKQGQGHVLPYNPNPIPNEIVDQAACVGKGELMFPTSGDTAMTKRAKKVCLECPVIRECRDYALRTKQLHGVWGGLSANDRKRIRRTAAANALQVG